MSVIGIEFDDEDEVIEFAAAIAEDEDLPACYCVRCRPDVVKGAYPVPCTCGPSGRGEDVDLDCIYVTTNLVQPIKHAREERWFCQVLPNRFKNETATLVSFGPHRLRKSNLVELTQDWLPTSEEADKGQIPDRVAVPVVKRK